MKNQSFVWGNELLSASGEESFYYLTDHLGSPIRLLGADAETAVALALFAEQAMKSLLADNKVSISKDGKRLIWHCEAARKAFFDAIAAMKSAAIQGICE